ncbi:unnamed protein product [Zymoseptoria tritici ST99CH_3D1]|nr:unnamed protein product [Zymoseptoria tritici ST99CH_3D1]
MQERKEDILVLKVRVEALKEELAAESSNCTDSLNNRPGCGMTTVVRNVFHRLPTVAELDAILREKALRASTIRRIALEWMETHTLARGTEQQQQHHHHHDRSYPQTSTSTSTTTPPPASCIPLLPPRSRRFPLTTTPSPYDHLAVTA